MLQTNLIGAPGLFIYPNQDLAFTFPKHSEMNAKETLATLINTSIERRQPLKRMLYGG